MMQDLGTIRQYKLIEKIGKGSYGDVYLVQLHENNCSSRYAAKIISIQNSQTNQINNEVKILQKMSHHMNIIRIKESFMHSDIIYKNRMLVIIMEYCKKGALNSLMGKGKKIKKIIQKIIQISQGVAQLHGQQIIHRDLKPQNILIGDGDQLKIADFGISKILNIGFPFTSTQIGTQFYRDPKIVNHTPYSFEVDIWSLALIIIQLITGFTELEIKQLNEGKFPYQMQIFPSPQIKTKIQNKQFIQLLELMCRTDGTRINITRVLQMVKSYQLKQSEFQMQNSSESEISSQQNIKSQEICGRVKPQEIYGRIQHQNGNIYDGELKYGRSHGQGTLKFANGDIYDGNFEEGQIYGNGKYWYQNKDFYNGNWRSNQRHGSGKCIYANETQYDGQWFDDLMHGKGVFTEKNRDFYNGQMRNGKKHGQGAEHKLVEKDGDQYYITQYQGNYSDDKRHGKGIQVQKGKRWRVIYQMGDLIQKMSL